MGSAIRRHIRARFRRLAELRHAGEVVCVAFSPDGRILAVLHETDPVIQLWNVLDPAKPVVLGTLPGAGAPVFSPDSRLLAVQPAPGGGLLWDISDPADPRALEAAATNPDHVKSVAISPDGKTLATGEAGDINGIGDIGDIENPEDGTGVVRLWDVSDPRNRRELATLAIKALIDPESAFSPDSRSLITWDNGDPHLWDIADRAHPRDVRAFEFNDGLVESVSFSGDGQRLVSAGDEVRLIDLAAFAMVGLHESTSNVEFAQDGRVLLAGAGYGKTRFWDVSDTVHPTVRTSFDAPPEESVSVVRQSPDGRVAAVEIGNETTQLWDMTAAAPRLAATLTGTGLGVAFSPDSRLVATEDWTEDHLPSLSDILSEPAGPMMSPSWTQLWEITDVDHPRQLAAMPNPGGAVLSRTFANRGKMFATATSEGTVGIWDVADARAPSRC